MAQSKKHSRLESITNAIIGLATSYITQLLVFPLFGIQVSYQTNAFITLMFFVISIVRSYWVRRLFNRLNF